MCMDKRFFAIDPECEGTPIPPERIFQKRNCAVTELVIHHSAGTNLRGNTPEIVAGIFGTEGKKLFYWRDKTGKLQLIESFLLNPFTGGLTWANAQFVLYKPNGKWVLVPLVRYTLSDICWHAGNRYINQISFGIEICGDYTGQYVEESALTAIADVFRPYSEEQKKQGRVFNISGHRDHFVTACPGMIYEQLGTLRKLMEV